MRTAPRPLFRAAAAAALCGAAALLPCPSAALPPPLTSRLFVANSVADLLAGDLWDVTSRAALFRELRGTPPHWPLVGLGTTSEAFHNGEIVVAGTAARPAILWCRPEYPEPVELAANQPLPFLAVARCRPDTAVRAALAPGEPVHQQVQRLAQEQGISLAAVLCTGTFRDVSGSVAYHLRKEGTPLTDPTVDSSRFTLPFLAPEGTPWTLTGFYVAEAAQQAVLSVPGASLHLHGARPNGTRGGHIGAAMPVSATVRLYPLAPAAARQSDVTVSSLLLNGDNLAFTVANMGDNTAAYVPVRGRAGGRTLFRVLVADLGPGQSRRVVVRPAWPGAARELLVEADPENDLRESDEGNNAAAL